MTRLEMIKNYRQTENERISAEAAELERNRCSLAGQILDLQPRILELIETANACVNNGITINHHRETFYSSDDTWERGTFCTNGITHKIGFVWEYQNQKFTGKIRYMGIDGGGACGEHYLRTDGLHVFSGNGTRPIDIRQATRFLQDFDKFEAAFYDYVDRIVSAARGGVTR